MLIGNAAFRYSESLCDNRNDSPFNISKWRELSTAANRALQVDVLQSF